MNRRTEQRFRVAISSYVIVGGIFGGMFAFTLYATLYTHPSFWSAAASFGAVFIAVLIWLAVFEIRITDDELRLRSLFGGVRRIKHSEIRNVRLGFGLRSNGGPLRLFIERNLGDVPTVSINAKVFSRDAIRAVLDLGERVAMADSAGLEAGIAMRAIRKGRSQKTEQDS
jgi:hypothetical protein